MANHKPLPEMPTISSRNSNPTFSNDARNHRSRLLKHILSEIQEPSIESKTNDWLLVFEKALDDLDGCIRRGDWLSGIKRARVEKWTVRQRRLKEELEQKKHRHDTKDTVEKVDNSTPESTENKEAVSDYAQPLERIRQLASDPVVPPPSPLLYHLVLCVATHGSKTPLPIEDSGFDLVPANIGCVFSAGTFALADSSSVLYGLTEWRETQPLKLVGGTFAFKGLTSPEQHQLLSRILRLSIYIHISLLLEQQFMKDSHVLLKFSRPKAIAPSPSAPNRLVNASQNEERDEHRTRIRGSLLPTGFFNLFSGKSFSRRSKTINSELGRGGSLDLTDSPSQSSPRPSLETGFRLRRFSIIGDRRPSLRKPNTAKEQPEADPPLLSALKRVQESSNFLSTSPGVSFKPPMLLHDLVEKEKEHPKRRLKGDERVGLSSLLGWDGREARGKGMSGTMGFVRQQEISVLFSQHIPPNDTTSQSEGSATITTSPPISLNLPQSGLKSCGKPQWITYRYYSHDPDEDRTLGEAINDLTINAQLPCEKAQCQYRRGQHELRLIHGGIRIVIRINNELQEPVGATEHSVESWESCAVCEATTSKNKLSDATFLFSFAKFLELLVYSPTICTLTPTLCEHTTPPPGSWSALPSTRLNIIRHFSTNSGTASFALSSIEDIFELRVPRLQIHRGPEKPSRLPSNSSGESKDSHGEIEDEKKVLRREIRQWWEGVADHIDKLERILVEGDLNAFHKALPRLPSSDDAYEIFEYDVKTLKAPSAALLKALPPSTPNSPSRDDNAGYFSTLSSAPNTISTLTNTSQTSLTSASTPIPAPAPAVPLKDDSAQLLATLRHGLQRIEQSLYSQLAKTPVSSLNDVRRTFYSAAKGTHKRVLAWEKKHLASKMYLVGELMAQEPQWWGKGYHVIPDGNIIVREDDWGSIIAFTLSTNDYHQELTNLCLNRSPVQQTPSDFVASTSTPSSFFSVASGYNIFASSSKAQPDPDREDVVWHEPEPFSAVIMRKEHTRDPTSLLSIRDVLRKNTPIEHTSGQSTPRTGSISSAASRQVGNTLLSAWAKPDVAVSMQAVGGEVNGLPEPADAVDKLMHGLEGISATDHQNPSSSRPSSVISEKVSNSSSSHLDAHVRRTKAASVVSADSDATVGKDNTTTAPPPPPKDDVSSRIQKDENDAASPVPVAGSAGTTPSSSFASTIASGLSVAMRFVMNNHESRPGSPSSGKHHALLNVDIEAIDERPHIKYDWTVGKRLKFSCTVYFAKQFDILRRRCGIDDVFVKSVSKSANWAAQGGKSKSNFWKTYDDRFIIKTLVNAWNVADLQALIDLAPSYFRYMESTASRATALAKLIGFYTIEVRNLETGNVQSKVDLLVMENLFYDQSISKTFDLKGIQGRKVKPNTKDGGTTKTLFDGEWIEGQQRTLMLVQPHSKRILREAIKSDAEFLARTNIMDYSLLLGVDEQKKQIACGLVDTIGSYTFAKTLEYKAKHGLQSGKEVTVIPPVDYQERFVNALEGYFLACPDKWSKPLDESKIINDVELLPSVL